MSIRSALQAAIATSSGSEELKFSEQQDPAAINRLAIERQVLAGLMAARQSGMSAQELFREARQVAPTLKYSTFRSHLHRLKKRQKIRNQDHGQGLWFLVQHANQSA
jgi:Fe2+ or Zn2+ uptake regulation protein